MLVLNLDGFEDDLLGQLLEWSPTVMASILPAEQLNSRGIKIDWLVSEDKAGTTQPNVNHLVCSQKNAIDTALGWLIANNIRL